MKEKELTGEEVLDALYELEKERAAATDVDMKDVKVSDREIYERIIDRRLR